VTARLTIDVWSDVMCPWCIIGYMNLMTGLELVSGEIQAEVRWRPFELNPDMPPEGEDAVGHVGRKYGRPAGEAAKGQEKIAAIAAAAGWPFDWSGEGSPPPRHIWNTFLAHKMLAHALAGYGAEVQTRLKLALFAAHFRERRNVSDRVVLLDVAEAQGLDRGRAEKALDDEALGQHVRDEEALACDMNVSGVPAMVVNGKYLIPGAQEPETYAQVLRKVAAKEAA